MELKYISRNRLFESSEKVLFVTITNLDLLTNLPVSLPFLRTKVFDLIRQKFPEAELDRDTITIPNDTYESIEGTYEPAVLKLTNPIQTDLAGSKIVSTFVKKHGEIVNPKLTSFVFSLDLKYLDYSEEEIKKEICQEYLQKLEIIPIDSIHSTIEELMILQSLGSGFYSTAESERVGDAIIKSVYYTELCDAILELDLSKSVIDIEAEKEAFASRIAQLKQDYSSMSDEEIAPYAKEAISLVKTLYNYMQYRGKEVSDAMIEEFSELMDYLESQPNLSAAINRIKKRSGA